MQTERKEAAQERENKPRNTTEKLLQSIKNRTSVAVISVIFGIIVGTGDLASAISHVWSLIHREPTPLMLAKENAKSEFSRRVTQEAWDRMFWMRSYLARVKRGAAPIDQETAWNKYADSSAQWNRDLMVNFEALEEYYPNSGKGAQFLGEIQHDFKYSGDYLADIRYSKLLDCSQQQNNCEAAEKSIDELNHALFIFVTTYSENELENKH